MKAIPKDDLIKLIETSVHKTFFEGDIICLFEEYGDDWYVSDSDHSKMELYKENKERKRLLNDKR